MTDPYPFRIVMPTSNAYVRYADISLALLTKYWPDHPTVDILHYEQCPGFHPNTVLYGYGPQAASSWSETLLQHLAHYPHETLLLMLDDYALCRPFANRHLLVSLNNYLDCVFGIHLTPQQAPVKIWNTDHRLSVIPPWTYIINLQAALWRAETLRALGSVLPPLDPWHFELTASRYWSRQRPYDIICQATMDPPPGGFNDCSDRMDKSTWVLPYHNLSHHGAFDIRHRAFLESEGFSVS